MISIYSLFLLSLIAALLLESQFLSRAVKVQQSDR
jgi:hypothetical protein